MELSVVDLGPHAACLVLNGRLDTPGVDEIETRFVDAARAAGRSVLVDLSGVGFVSSMGVRMLITTARSLQASQRRMALFGAQSLVAEMLDTVALDQIIPVARDQAGAFALLQP